ncbi:hypothetical protein D3870_03990 [Noviherbaspirillum cavernae]|uniref:Uncharacterized protein n=1 Tax=Noviherbaspirillum cavernae TaxID=2320862 RepID=A0A418WYH3_9BURK|nr:hypothetical protein [Noviherbaspirillum cavernae]RJG05289.1 hypothetical protein D3870_03990 [Noviherbaspirillum cavernae]
MCTQYKKKTALGRTFWRACIAMAVFLSAALGLAGQAQAACTGSQSAGTVACSNVAITLLYVEMDGDVYVATDGDVASTGCTANGGLIRLPGTAAKFNAAYATLLAAQASGRRISIRMSSAVQYCTATYLTLASQ